MTNDFREPQWLGSTNEIRNPNVFHHVPIRKFSLLQKLNPIFWFQNADDPRPPEDYRPGKACRGFYWYTRNSFHNLTFYVIGIADKDFFRHGRLPNQVFNPRGGWNWAVSRYGILYFPFVSYQHGRFRWYWGWRNSGNFGMKLNFNAKD